jgi:hypothetical protein
MFMLDLTFSQYEVYGVLGHLELSEGHNASIFRMSECELRLPSPPAGFSPVWPFDPKKEAMSLRNIEPSPNYTM